MRARNEPEIRPESVTATEEERRRSRAAQKSEKHKAVSEKHKAVSGKPKAKAKV